MQRQSNIELCRIAAIILVVLVHSNFAWTGMPHETNAAFSRFLLQAFSIIGVNVFVLITGYFSAGLKAKNIMHLLYICFFYAMIRLIYGAATGNLITKDVFFISHSNWFIVSYLGLLLFTPLLNDMVKNKFLLISVGGGLIVYELWFSFFPALSDIEPGFYHGYSVLAFIVLYLIGRYIRFYEIPVWIKRGSMLLYVMLSILIAACAYVAFLNAEKVGLHKTIYTRLYDYNNPMVIFSAICFFLFFERLKIYNIKWVNHIAKSTLGVLLVHGSAALNPQMKQYFNNILFNYSGFTLVCLWFFGTMVIFIISVLIDQARIITWFMVAPKLVAKTEEIFGRLGNLFKEEG